MDSLDRPVPAPRSVYRHPGSCRGDDELSDDDHSSAAASDDQDDPVRPTRDHHQQHHHHHRPARHHAPAANNRPRWPPSSNSRGTGLQRCELPAIVIAKFHYTDTDPNGLARTQRRFAAKKSVSVSGPCRARVVEFSSYPTTCADFVRVGPVSGPCPCPCSGIQLLTNSRTVSVARSLRNRKGDIVSH